PREHADRHPDEEREPDSREHERERLDALRPQPHQRERRERSENAERLLPMSEPRDDERPERDGSDPRHLVEERPEPRHEVVEEVREPVEHVEEEARVRHVATVAQPVLESVEVADEGVPDERVRPRPGVLPAEEPDQHREDDEENEAYASSPPRTLRRDRG